MSERDEEKVLVTGGASFIGSRLFDDLVAHGADVRVADDPSSGEPENLEAVADEIEVLERNLKDRQFADEATAGIDTVFPPRGRPQGRGYIAYNPANCPSNMALDNIVYETATLNRIEWITFASSACVYPTDIQREKRPLREDIVSFEERGGAFADEVQGWAKLMAEWSRQAYHEQQGIDATSVRIFTAYDPRKNETDMIIALMTKAYAQQNPFRI